MTDHFCYVRMTRASNRCVLFMLSTCLNIYFPFDRLKVRRVTERLITAIDDHHTTGHIVSSAYANWPPPSRDSPPPSHADTPLYKPCAKAATVLMPFRPETSNPTKIFEQEDWKLYVVDLVGLTSLRFYIYKELSDVAIAADKCIRSPHPRNCRLYRTH
jgi:hypothetical protein